MIMSRYVLTLYVMMWYDILASTVNYNTMMVYDVIIQHDTYGTTILAARRAAGHAVCQLAKSAMQSNGCACAGTCDDACAPASSGRFLRIVYAGCSLQRRTDACGLFISALKHNNPRSSLQARCVVHFNA